MTKTAVDDYKRMQLMKSRLLSCFVPASLVCVQSHTCHMSGDVWRHLTYNPMILTFGQRTSGTFCNAVRRHTSTETHLETYKQFSKTHKYPFNQFLCSVKAEKHTKKVDNYWIFAMLLRILSWTKCSLQKSKVHLFKSVSEKGTRFVFTCNATGGWFRIQSGRRFRKIF